MEIKVENLSKIYGPDTILSDITFSVEKGQKIGLVGGNGAGKSTLLKILAGITEYEKGRIAMRHGLRLFYVPQDPLVDEQLTVLQYLLGIATVPLHEMEKILSGFGMRNAPLSRKISSLSSGEKSKVFLSGALLFAGDVLLLDEPTNNLDIPSLIWLENYLSQSTLTLMIVSHDRIFLDNIINKIYDIDWHKRTISTQSGKYSTYLLQKEKEIARQKKIFERQQDEIERLHELAAEMRLRNEEGSQWEGTDNDKLLIGFKRDQAKGAGRRAKAIETRIEQTLLVEKPLSRRLFRIYLKATPPKGTSLISVEKIHAGYAEGFQIGPISMLVKYGSRIAIIGQNGCGKSTLLKTIGGEIKALSGVVSFGSSLVVGNMMQEHDDMSRDWTLKEFLTKKAKLGTQDAYALAVKYGFRADELTKRIASFSPGGRSRALFALFTALSVNVLLLDEPTNHLDLEAMDALEEMIAHYDGTIITVSHDRYFLERFGAEDLYIIEAGELKRLPDLHKFLVMAEKRAKKMIAEVD